MPTDPIYGTARWRRLRRQHLQMHPICETCFSEEGRIVLAVAVDHRKAISQGGDPFPDHDGLASLCWKHHSQKTARSPEAGAVWSDRPRKGCRLDGSPLDPAHPWHPGRPEKRQGSEPSTPRANLPAQLVSKKDLSNG